MAIGRSRSPLAALLPITCRIELLCLESEVKADLNYQWGYILLHFVRTKLTHLL
jgi:hypothetical protein